MVPGQNNVRPLRLDNRTANEVGSMPSSQAGLRHFATFADCFFKSAETPCSPSDGRVVFRSKEDWLPALQLRFDVLQELLPKKQGVSMENLILSVRAGWSYSGGNSLSRQRRKSCYVFNSVPKWSRNSYEPLVRYEIFRSRLVAGLRGASMLSRGPKSIKVDFTW